MRQSQPYKSVYILGDHYSGKSTLVHRIIGSIADADITVTKPDDMTTTYHVVESDNTRYEVTDVRTNELYFAYNCGDIAKSADLLIMVYESENVESIKMCKKLLDNMADSFNSYKHIIFVGNKSDVVSKTNPAMTSVTKQIISQKHQNYEIVNSLTISALDGRNFITLNKAMRKQLGLKTEESCCLFTRRRTDSRV